MILYIACLTDQCGLTVEPCTSAELAARTIYAWIDEHLSVEEAEAFGRLRDDLGHARAIGCWADDDPVLGDERLFPSKGPHDYYLIQEKSLDATAGADRLIPELGDIDDMTAKRLLGYLEQVEDERVHAILNEVPIHQGPLGAATLASAATVLGCHPLTREHFVDFEKMVRMCSEGHKAAFKLGFSKLGRGEA